MILNKLLRLIFYPNVIQNLERINVFAAAVWPVFGMKSSPFFQKLPKK